MPTTVDLTGLHCEEIDEVFRLVGQGVVSEPAAAEHVARLRRAHLLAEVDRIPGPKTANES